MSRSFGDFYLKQQHDAEGAILHESLQPVVGIPGVTVHRRGESDVFMVLATDGVWDVVDNQEAVQLIEEHLGGTGGYWSHTRRERVV